MFIAKRLMEGASFYFGIIAGVSFNNSGRVIKIFN